MIWVSKSTQENKNLLMSHIKKKTNFNGTTCDGGVGVGGEEKLPFMTL